MDEQKFLDGRRSARRASMQCECCCHKKMTRRIFIKHWIQFALVPVCFLFTLQIARLPLSTTNKINDLEPPIAAHTTNLHGSSLSVSLPSQASVSQECTSLMSSPELQQYCGDVRKKCQRLDRRPPPFKVAETNSPTTATSCKTLWITGISYGYEGKHELSNKSDGYFLEYSAALNSALQHASGVLQPVLFLMTPHDFDAPIPFVAWTQNIGVIVIRVHDLSFQDVVYQHFPQYREDGRIGYFLRLDLPQLMDKHRLFELPNACQQYILYTDADVMFNNPLSSHDLDALKQKMNSANQILMFGQDWLIHRRKPSNTGVMILDVEGFSKVWPKILVFGQEQKRGEFPEHDQLWLVRYYASPQRWKKENALLPPQWNWKLYWELGNDMKLSDIRISHFHGPKSMSGIEEIGSCAINRTESLFDDYKFLVKHAICCDQGRTANTLLPLYRKWRLPRLPTEAEVYSQGKRRSRFELAT